MDVRVRVASDSGLPFLCEASPSSACECLVRRRLQDSRRVLFPRYLLHVAERGCEFGRHNQNMHFGHVEQLASNGRSGNLLRGPRCGWRAAYAPRRGDRSRWAPTNPDPRQLRAGRAAE